MYRERLTITLDADVLTGIDSLIDGERLRNRSQTIEHLLRQGIGLHELRQAFIFIEEQYDTQYIQELAKLCAHAALSEVYLCLPLAKQHLIAELSSIISAEYSTQAKTCSITLVPSDFGSGGSVLLKQTELTTPFLLAWPNTSHALPSSLIEPFLFHKHHHATLTEFCIKDSSTYTPINLAIASPDLLSHIPAGASSLHNNVFPALLKAGRVKGYLYSA